MRSHLFMDRVAHVLAFFALRYLLTPSLQTIDRNSHDSWCTDVRLLISLYASNAFLLTFLVRAVSQGSQAERVHGLRAEREGRARGRAFWLGRFRLLFCILARARRQV